MSTIPPSIALQPIEPAMALAEVPDRVTTDRFTVAAEICMRARDDLARRGYKPDGQKNLRRFGIWEITTFMLPVTAQHLRRVLKANPDLPQGEAEKPGGPRSFSLDEVNAIRRFLEAEGQQGKGYRPYRPEGQPAKIVSVCNFKGGVSKTTTGAHLAMAAALDGYRVLVVDLDSQASMSTMFGTTAEDESQTAYSILARHRARHVARTLGIEDPADPRLDDEIRDAMKISADDVIFGTHWPTIDILPAQLNLYWAEFQVPVWRMQMRNWALWDALGSALTETGIVNDYDIILLDTPPALGYLTINALSAADILLVPLGASFLEFDSTGRFFDMIYSTFASIEEGENRTRRAQGLPEMRFEWDAVRALITRFDAAQQTDLANVIQAYFGDFMTTYRQEVTAMVGQAGEQVSGIYETDYRDFNRDTYVRGRETFDRTWAEVKQVILGAWWRDQKLAEKG